MTTDQAGASTLAAADSARARGARQAGLLYGLGAYLLWGFIAFYFKQIEHVAPLQVVAHRIVWSVILLVAMAVVLRRLTELRRAVTQRRTMLLLGASTLLIAGNWFVFIYAVATGRLIECSLGYFINPLVAVLLGAIFLRERLGVVQMAAVALAALGVANLVHERGALPWIALSLAFSFGFYGLLRKVAEVGPVVGLLVETALLAPLALGLIVAGVGGNGPATLSASDWGWLALGGPVTVIPLLLFAAGARRLRLATMGLLQYVAPTCQFMLAVLAFGERTSPGQLLTFVLIWTGLVVYTVGSLRAARSAARAAVA